MSQAENTVLAPSVPETTGAGSGPPQDNPAFAAFQRQLKNDKLMRPEAIAARIAEMLEAGIKTGGMAVEAVVLKKDLDVWIAGKRDVDTTDKLSDWIQGMDKELSESSGGLVDTPTSKKILNAFEKAREARGSDGRRGIAAIFGAAGAGKTAAAKWLESVDGGVVHFQVNGESKTYVSILRGVLEKTHHPGIAATGEATTSALLRVMKKGDLIIIDHAQLLQMRVIEQLTVFPDEYGIGLALIGNAAGYKALMDAKTKQILSRIGGALVHVENPGEDDVDPILESEQISGRHEREFCLAIGCQDGGLRYLYEAIREARKLQKATGAKRLELRLLKLGAENAGHWGAQP